jgi:hypothetical protein
MLADSMDDYFLPDVSMRTRSIVGLCALGVFVVCVVLLFVLWPI